MNKIKGFSLIELAMILVIIGILLSIGVTTFSVLTKKAKYEESKEIVNAAVEGIISYANTHKRLPSNSDELLQAVKRNKDAYTKELLYIYDETASNSCGVNSTNIIIHICKDATCSSFQEIQNVAFLVVSGGANYNIQTGNSSLSIVEQPPSKPFWVVKVSSATTINVYDYGTKNIDNFPSDMNRPEDYDDIVKWVNVYELQTKASLGCQPLHIITENPLPEATEGQSYNYQLQAEGGKPPYTWTGSIGHGLTLNSDGSISGTLDKCINGDITFTVAVTDDAGYSVSKDFTIPVKHIPVEITTTSLPSTLQGSSYNAQVYATGGDGTYTFSGTIGNCSTNANLLNGLTIGSDGKITGTIGTDSNNTCDADTCSITITASSCGGSRTDTKILPLIVNDPDCSTAGGGSGSGSGGSSGGGSSGGSSGSSCIPGCFNNVDFFCDGSEIALFKLDGNANDASGTYNGTISGRVSWVTGKFGQAAKSRGGKINIPLNYSGNIITISFWAKWSGRNSVMPIGFYLYDLWLPSRSGPFGFNTSNSDVYGISWNPFSTTRWVHVVAEFHEGDVTADKLWINGNPQALSKQQGRPLNSYATLGDKFHIFGWGADNRYNKFGSIDQVRIFNRALTDSEVQQLYNPNMSCP
ncbi:putative Ig domain-containing protein [Hydrogenothermus marinus]|uniref:Type II secretory pathway pseudopilin PulG n=1 Tax=Hydrogenothermus marinus TaxID=133270 RepID=A0A3M0BJB2_9AQUI|nr:putative Ig domain-containing protein [Hydrogenothermus marinus]RMA97533.1 type II secretory pathway pseudopilin PulG [Hydrogenothermus marinus]